MSQRMSQSQLAERLAYAAEHVTVGTRYAHYKQTTYKVLGLGLREEDNEPCVIYQAEYGEHITFIRPLANWLEPVATDQGAVARFTKLED